jgi:ribosomal protein S18 acetylase RimI-like enzyme
MSAVTQSTVIGEARPATGGADPLDNVIYSALTSRQGEFGESVGLAARFQGDVAPFAGMAGGPGTWAWDDLAALVGPGGVATLFFVEDQPPSGWKLLDRIGLVQMVATAAFADAPEPAARRLGPADVPAMLDLVERTRPGPYKQRTLELGAYLGIFDGEALVGMAGERMRVPGHTEISAVCTDPAYRGQGLATRLMRAVAAEIRGRGETPFLHASALNTTAIRLYEHLGFVTRVTTNFQFVRAPSVLRPLGEEEPWVIAGECG